MRKTIFVFPGEGSLRRACDQLDSHRTLLGRRISRHQGEVHARALSALRGCALRARLPGLCLLSHAGGIECPGLQPLHRSSRYCGNNCPYTARQFNWFDPHWDPPLQEQLNPDVTVRQNGIMEKCTFCVQRIRQGKEQAEREGRPLRDGRCHAGLRAILSDHGSGIRRWKRSR